ncbi:hypothetical protein [Bradyrhizobium sp. AUGA SZCCT0283]|uniref:hypothetical protein n=1 Tax=Bradyrhizobium sp. AUGA SZCCT0283 TaxID=2807671 RepID=UPI002011647E|nr:hypothetical protein [Bradyrhizobium sp. AUGA SZCCT0283]
MIFEDIPSSRATQSRSLRTRKTIVPTLIGLAIVGGIITATELRPILVCCPIKGKINATTGERIYHMSGQKFYFGWVAKSGSVLKWTRAAGWRTVRI